MGTQPLCHLSMDILVQLCRRNELLDVHREETLLKMIPAVVAVAVPYVQVLAILVTIDNGAAKVVAEEQTEVKAADG
jgi:hypothetical protein